MDGEWHEVTQKDMKPGKTLKGMKISLTQACDKWYGEDPRDRVGIEFDKSVPKGRLRFRYKDVRL